MSAEDDDGNCLAPSGMAEAKRKWHEYSATLRHSMGDSTGDFQAWTLTGALCVGVSTPRAKDVVNVGWLYRTRQAHLDFIKRRDAVEQQNTSRRRASSLGSQVPQAPTRENLAQDFVARPYQSVKMMPWSRRFGKNLAHGVVTCLTTRDLVYSYKHDCVLPPRGHLYIQGFPRTVCTRDLRDSDIKALAGNSFNWIPLAAVLYAMFCDESAPWWKSS